MEFKANPKKNVEITVNGKTYLRHAIKTHFVEPGENYIDIMREYALPVYADGDMLSISEKIIGLCQKRIIYKKDLKVGFWAKFLSKFVMKTPAGYSVGNPLKMQVAINLVGLPKVIYAAICGFIGKIFGKRGVFYIIVGQDVAGLDGFYGEAYSCYADMGILNPLGPDKVCNEIRDQLGMTCMIVDANDLGVEILGRSSDITLDTDTLKAIIKDNPAGQSSQQTPIILIREKADEE
ncbi:MAG: F420-0--gamma-glutamyl ligase [Clostridia bacterium]|nr:F420-0--gamma-glutamyl ligase [Clostridia bacterium]